MKKYVNGESLELTAQDIVEMQNEVPAEPTFEERLAALESAMLEQILNG